MRMLDDPLQHRDLHQGQILVRPTSSTDSPLTQEGPFAPSSLQTSIIDFGLSRVSAPSGETWWTTFEDEHFEGSGGQSEVYREMRDVLGGDLKAWGEFEQKTNLMVRPPLLNFFISSPVPCTSSDDSLRFSLGPNSGSTTWRRRSSRPLVRQPRTPVPGRLKPTLPSSRSRLSSRVCCRAAKKSSGRVLKVWSHGVSSRGGARSGWTQRVRFVSLRFCFLPPFLFSRSASRCLCSSSLRLLSLS